MTLSSIAKEIRKLTPNNIGISLQEDLWMYSTTPNKIELKFKCYFADNQTWIECDSLQELLNQASNYAIAQYANPIKQQDSNQPK